MKRTCEEEAMQLAKEKRQRLFNINPFDSSDDEEDEVHKSERIEIATSAFVVKKTTKVVDSLKGLESFAELEVADYPCCIVRINAHPNSIDLIDESNAMHGVYETEAKAREELLDAIEEHNRESIRTCIQLTFDMDFAYEVACNVIDEVVEESDAIKDKLSEILKTYDDLDQYTTYEVLKAKIYTWIEQIIAVYKDAGFTVNTNDIDTLYFEHVIDSIDSM